MYKLQRDYITNPLQRGEKPIKEDLEYLYIDCNLSATEISEQYITNKSRMTIQRYLINYDIKKTLDLKKENVRKRNIIKYGGVAPACSKQIQAKMKQTSLERYGVENYSQTDEFKETYKQTSLERYGVENYSQTDEFKENLKLISLEKYGVEHISQSQKIKEKKKQTNIKRYGGVAPSCSNEVTYKAKQTSIKKYGVECTLQAEEYIKLLNSYNGEYCKSFSQVNIPEDILIKLNNKDKLIKLFEDNNTKSITIIADNLNIAYTTLQRYLKKHNLNEDYRMSGSSSFEEEILTKIKEFYDGEVLTNTRILSSKEVDIYLPEFKLGIEFNGDYWHSEVKLLEKRYDPKTYHYEKSMLARDKGIFLLHIFEYEYNRDKDKYISYIKQLMGFVEEISIEDCIINRVSENEYGKFIEENSLREIDNSHIRLGLYHDGGLVEVIGLTKLDNNEYELHYTSKFGIKVTGGLDKLFNRFIDDYIPNRIICYNRIHNSKLNIFETLNFKYIYTTEPTAKYVNNNVIYDCGEEVYERIFRYGY